MNQHIFANLEHTFNDLLELFFPSLCIACGNRLVSQEKYLCLSCWADLPVTNFHLEAENKVAQIFWGRVQIENATAWFHFRKGSNYQQIIHFIKYKGIKELGLECGKRLGSCLAVSEGFKNIDAIVPVPLHPKKHKKRGFNQSEWIAKGISEMLEKPLITGNLHRKIHTSTQTKKNRLERWQNVEGIFAVKNPEEFSGKHLLLIDDVATTGATLEACAEPLLNSENTKVSIATLAYADI
ncbi:MAG TPA: ComF family protein [Prolixibacteraceae bacterium]|nr:ComF family protein [Prolixibacteraceae bacterium]